ncbi:uncharacterized protein C1orf198 homolog isoform X2 [Agrilus planipennis]|uniref:Uncharacterized protein C1orf198 homolog isoform X2 n=1 Tax=Agrilus planipennis TaxID=224129 RepID=A0A1W4X953_AGRPL|nr:uncharacterized protein C1orf198 homolog isoform X2 [Agrilus planipennis]
MSLKSIADQYFGSINTMASRLYTDMNETKVAYDKLWLSLSEKEQNQIMNESIIKPEACLQYNTVRCKEIAKEEYAAKTVIDDNCSYRDEHSAPFSFRTPSQRDLTICLNDSSDNMQGEIKKTSKPKTEVVAKVHVICNKNSWHDDEDSFSSVVPKTGLDFLDNW